MVLVSSPDLHENYFTKTIIFMFTVKQLDLESVSIEKCLCF